MPEGLSGSTDKHARILSVMAGLGVVCVPLIMRLLVICNPPATDEGYYAFHAMLAHHWLTAHGGLPPLGPLHLYPLLCSFVFSWNINHLIALRLCDLLIAMAVAWQWFHLLREESGSLVAGLCLGVLSVLAFNHPLFIQNGFKNPLSIAFLFLIPALRLGLKTNGKDKRTLFLSGALVAVAILFREALAPVAVIGFFGVLAAYGRRSAAAYALGGISTAFVLLACLAVARGGLGNILEAYAQFSAMARGISGGYTTFAALNVIGTELAFLAPLGGALLLGLLVSVATKRIFWPRLLFWMALALAPLPEILSKGASPYHYSISLLGLSGLTACLWRPWQSKAPKLSRLAWILILFSCLWLFPQRHGLPQRLETAARRLPLLLSSAAWPEEMVQQSNYLLMAKAIKDAAPPDATLLISGYYHVLYPLSGLLPPPTDNHLFDLGAYARVKKFSFEELSAKIQSERPTVIVLSQRPETGADILEKALSLLPEYKKAAEILGCSVRKYISKPQITTQAFPNEQPSLVWLFSREAAGRPAALAASPLRVQKRPHRRQPVLPGRHAGPFSLCFDRGRQVRAFKRPFGRGPVHRLMVGKQASG